MRVAGLEQFAGSARIWIFSAERELDRAEEDDLLGTVDNFLDGWAAHGAPLRAARSWRYQRFLIVGVDLETAPPSGCSIDTLVKVLKALEGRLGIRFLGNEAVWYRDETGCIRQTSRPGFRALAREGRVTPGSVVFDNSITALSELRTGRWEGPARERWHSTFFPA